MAIEIFIKMKNGKRIESDFDKDKDKCLKEIMALEESEIQSVLCNLEDVHYNMDFENQVMCISAENHIELISMSELKNLKEVILIGFYEEFLSSGVHEELWEKAYVNERINKYLLP